MKKNESITLFITKKEATYLKQLLHKVKKQIYKTIS